MLPALPPLRIRRLSTSQSPSGFFPWAVVLASGLMLFGVHLDAWAHHRFALESFFTPWHGLLYSGYALLAAVLVIRARHGGRLSPAALPDGYGLSLVGALLFGLGGLVDLGWHTRFGIEVDVEALLSPPHLLLAFGAGLMVSGPLRAASARQQALDWPAVASWGLLLSVLTFFTAYVNPLAEQELFAQSGNALGGAGVVVQSLLLVGTLLSALRRGPLPRGAATILLGLSSALMLLVHQNFELLLPLLAAGLMLDFLIAVLHPTPARPQALQIFAATLPVLLFTPVVMTLALRGELAWSFTFASGAVLSAAFASWCLSLVVFPSQKFQ